MAKSHASAPRVPRFATTSSKDQAAGRSCSKTPQATSSNSSNPPPSTQRDETLRVCVPHRSEARIQRACFHPARVLLAPPPPQSPLIRDPRADPAPLECSQCAEEEPPFVEFGPPWAKPQHPDW